MFVDSTTGALSLGTASQLTSAFAHAAPARVCSVVQSLPPSLSSPPSLPYQLSQLISSSPLPLPPAASISDVFSHLIVADVSLRQLSTGVARRFLDGRAGAPDSINWSARA